MFTLLALFHFFNPILLFPIVLLNYLMVNQHMSLILALSSFPIPLFLNMFLVFLLFHLILCLSVSSLKACLFVLCFCLNPVSFKTFLVGVRLEWVRSKMVCICYRTLLLGLHLLCQITSPPTRTSSQLFLAFLSNKDMSILWHFRLGHPSFNKLSSLQDVLPLFSTKCNDICTICPLAKQKGLPFPSNNNMCTEPFALIHVDV